MKKLICLVSLLAIGNPSFSQDKSKYFDFWEGTWHQVIEGKVDTTATKFIVHRGMHEFFFTEDWWMVDSEGGSLKAYGIRSWDQVNSTWSYVWLSAEGHYQIWDTKKVDGHWYIYKTFNFNGDKYLSRQAWIPTSANELTRVSEKSYDNGQTWELRFREFYRKEN